MLRFVDSCDHYQTADITQKYTTVPFSPAIVAAAGSCSSQGMRFTAFSQVVKGLTFTTTTVGYGHRLVINTAAVGVLIGLGGIGHATGRHLIMYRAYDGSLQIYRNDASSGLTTTFLGATAADVVRVGDAYYIELKAKIDNAVGTVDVRINGVNVLALTGQDTQGSSSGISSFWMGNEAGNGNCEFDIDDLYVFDSQAGQVADFVGPVRAEWLKPDGDGTYVADFTLVGAGSQSTAVRDASGPDGDTSYVQSATVNHKHTSTLQNTGLPAGTIYGVQTLLNARLTDAGYRGIKPLMRQSGADYLGTEQYPGSSYRYLHEVQETDPATSSAWLIAGVNSLELGAKVTT